MHRRPSTRWRPLRELLFRWRAWIGLALALGLATAGLGAIEPLFYQRLVDLLVARSGWQRGAAVLLALAAVLAGQKLTQAAQSLAVSRIRFALSFELSARVLGKLYDQPLAFHQKSGAGYILTRVDRGVAALGQLISDSLQTLLPNLAGLILMVVFLTRLSPRLAAVALAPMPLFLWATLRGARCVARHEEVVQEGWSRLYGRVSEVLTGIKTVKSLAGEEREILHYRTQARLIFQRLWRQVFAELGYGELQGGLALAGRLGVAVYGFMLVLRGGASAGTWIAAVTYAGLLYAPLAGLAGTYSNAIRGGVAAGVALDFLGAVPSAPAAAPVAMPAMPLPRLRGQVIFEQVSYAYPAEPELPPRFALDGVSFRLEAGETAAIIGPSGGGKTTLVDLLLKFHAPAEGRILVDGRDLATIGAGDLRRQMAVVLQEPLLLEGTIAENLAYGCATAPTDAALRRALRTAQAEEFVGRLPLGLATRLGERGARLSGGEKQRLAIARALLRDPRILILDEATAHLDAASEAALNLALRELVRDRTAIVISHRLATLIATDRILVVEGGYIREQGTPRELAGGGGFYARWATAGAAQAVL